jgi:hypothetical protein
METAAFVNRYPRLYHMAERATWPSIKKLGLLSTTAILDKYKIAGAARAVFERQHRPEKSQVGNMVLRDQKPMPPSRLKIALPSNITPGQWYRFLNGLVFMWAEESRLLRLLGARPYRTLEHDVLTIDTQAFVDEYEASIKLAHMNSGSTFRMPHKRDFGLFKPIADYETRRSGAPAKNVVEVVTNYAVPDIRKFVLSVDRMRADKRLERIGP